MNTMLRQILFAGATLAVVGHVPVSYAQTARADDGGAVLEEVIITAEKRSENLQKTPVAVSVASMDDLVRSGALQLADIQKVIPDIRLDRQGPGMTVNIRGVFSTDNSPTAEAANAVHLNGAYLAKTTGLQGFLYDLERVEVAKGPQGTLYGRNANGGTINIISRKPVIGEKSASGELQVGNYSLLRTSAALNVGLSDTWAMRIAAQSYVHKGYMKSGLDDADEKGGRLSLLWKPSDNQSFMLIADSSIIGGKGPGNNVIGKAAPANAAVPVPSDPRDDVFFMSDTPSGKAEVYKLDSINNGLTAQYDYTFTHFTWTTQAAWRHFDSKPIGINNPGTSDSTNPASTEYLKAARNYVPQHFTSTSLETRLSSVETRPLQWVAGLYGFHDKNGGTMIGYGNMRTTAQSIEVANGEEIAKSFAGFGQVTYTPTGLDSLHIIAGARYTRDSKDAKGIFTQPGPTPFTGTPISGSKTWSATTYKAGVSYDLTDSSLLYGHVSTGYKAGGFGYGPGTTSAGPVYEPEKIKAYEVGSKNRFLDDRLQVNAEAFYYKYRDYQTNLVLFGVNPGPPILTVSSAGRATYKGGSLNVQWALTDADFLKVNYTALRAKYDEYIVTAPPGYTLGGTVLATDLSDTDIVGVPRWSGNASYSHTFKLSQGSLDAQLASNFRGPIKFAIVEDPVVGTPSPTAVEPGRSLVQFGDDTSWAMWDVSLRYQSEAGDWSITGYVNNVADADHPTFGGYSAQTRLYTEQFYPPRTFGLIFSIKIDGT